MTELNNEKLLISADSSGLIIIWRINLTEGI